MTSVPPTSTTGTPDGLDNELLQLATDIARQAGSLLIGGLLRSDLAMEVKSSPTDLVTEMDTAAEELIVGRLQQARPTDAIVGEEGTDHPGSSGVRWIIDPIDGTTNYVYGHPGFAVSIAAEVDGETLVGVVHNPLHEETFTAVRNRGAHRNGDPIATSTCTDMSQALVATGFSYDPERRHRQAGVLAAVIASIRDLRRMGAASTDLCSVACGRVDAYYERGLKPWDYAAGALIATEAGAMVTDLDGGRPSPEFTLATAPGLWQPLSQLLDGAGARSA